MNLRKTRLFSLLLAFFMIFILAACAGSDTRVIDMDRDRRDRPVRDRETPPRENEAPPQETPPPVEHPQTPEPITSRPFPFEFSTVDIFGNNVTEKSFLDKELFFIHYWGTWCPPCIDEMPDIAEVIRNFNQSVGFLMLLDDFDNTRGALNIYNDSGVPETGVITVCAWDTFPANSQIVSWLGETGAAPTTIILDADGNLLNLMPGAHFSLYNNYLDYYLKISRGQISAAGPVDLMIDKFDYSAGDIMNISVIRAPQELVDASGWIGFFYPGAPNSAWDELDLWAYVSNPGPNFYYLDVEHFLGPGNYEIRLFADSRDGDDALLIMIAPFTVR